MSIKHFSTTKKSTLSIAAFVAVLLVLGVSEAVSVHAETVPTTKCVTTATKKTRDAAVAQMEKDITPYKNSADSSGVIAYYKEELDIAWEAMEYPYCGFGAYGTTSAIKSYNKTISRARSKFLTDIKSKKVVAEKVIAPAVEKAPVKTEVKTEAKPEVKTLVAPSPKRTPIVRGLRRGQRSEQVKELQRRLVEHFKLTPESDYITGYFGPLTQKYLIKYQIEKKVIKSEKEAGAGLVGPKTTATLNAE